MNKIIEGDSTEVLKTMVAESVDCVITSPPYWGLRDYGHDGQLGLEPNFKDYIEKLCLLFDEVRRVLKTGGTLWVNIGDSYAGGKGASSGLFESQRDLKRTRVQKPHHYTGKKGHTRPLDRLDIGVPAKSLVQIPARFAAAMVDRGWILRNEIIWHKPNCMPSSVKDRFTVDFEKIFFFTKSKKYYFKQQYEKNKDPEDDARRIKKAREYNRREEGGNSTFNSPQRDDKALREQLARGRNMRAVWNVPTVPFNDAHFATFPVKLVSPMVKAGCPRGGGRA